MWYMNILILYPITYLRVSGKYITTLPVIKCELNIELISIILRRIMVDLIHIGKIPDIFSERSNCVRPEAYLIPLG